MFTFITDKEKAKCIEGSTEPIMNLYSDFKTRQKILDLYMRVLDWYRTQGLDANDSIYKKWNMLSKLFGSNPAYHPTYVHRNALWVIKWDDASKRKDDTHVLLYYDKRGMKIEATKNFPASDVVTLLEQLSDVLNRT